MAINIPLMILSRVVLSVVGKVVVGVTVAGLTYAFLNNTVLPVIHRIESAILSQMSSFFYWWPSWWIYCLFRFSSCYVNSSCYFCGLYFY